jgi:hypothetical protein
MTSSYGWVLDIGAGIGIFLIGFGVFVVCLRLSSVLGRLNDTLDEVDKQLGYVAAPVAAALSHIGGIADTADATIARLGGVVGQLETVAGSVSKTAVVASEAITPSIVNVGAALAGVTAGLRRLTRGKNGGVRE